MVIRIVSQNQEVDCCVQGYSILFIEMCALLGALLVKYKNNNNTFL